MMITKSARKRERVSEKVARKPPQCQCKDDVDTELKISSSFFDIYKSRSTILFPNWADNTHREDDLLWDIQACFEPFRTWHLNQLHQISDLSMHLG